MIRRLHVLAHGDRSIDAEVHVGSTILGIDKDLFVFVATIGGAGAAVGYLFGRSLVWAAIAGVVAVFVVPIALVITSGPR